MFFHVFILLFCSVCVYIYVYTHTHFLFSFWSKMAWVAICRLELNAADWNLNCDLAVANCESTAELLIKPFSSSQSRFSFVCWFIFLYHIVRLGFCYFKSSDQPFLKILYFSVHKQLFIIIIFHQTLIFQFVVLLQFQASGQVWFRKIDVVIPRYLSISCVSLYTFLIFLYELLALSLTL